jgi:cell division protein ZapE
VKLDQAQLIVKASLDALLIDLEKAPKSILSRIFGATQTPPHGLYIWGSVGRGKTMLMDEFFSAAPSLPKRRIHFHGFMQEVHAARAVHKSNDVIGEIADGIASKARLLCLDEMQVTDIADAMILGRLFDALLTRDVVIVTTSNQPPDNLYRDGLNRQLFVPFIGKLKAALNVIRLEDGPDYRLGRIAAHKTYITPLGAKARAKLNRVWNELADGAEGQPEMLEVLGRTLEVPRAAHACAWFTFEELCEKPLGSPDYLKLAETYRTIFIDEVPVFKATDRNETKRFILFIDTAYDKGTRLVISAATEPEMLCPAGQHRAEFLRTASRLREMQSKSWWKK